MTQVRIVSLGPHEFDAFVTEGYDSTHHRVVVPDSVLDELVPLPEPGDEERLVRAALDFLLERLPADAIPRELDLAELRYGEPDFFSDVSARLSG